MTVGHLYIFFGNMSELLRWSIDEWLSGIRDSEREGVVLTVKGSTREIFVVMFCILAGVKSTRIYTCDEMTELYIHIPLSISWFQDGAVVTLRCDPWGKLGNAYAIPLYTVFATCSESVIISKLKVKNLSWFKLGSCLALLGS